MLSQTEREALSLFRRAGQEIKVCRRTVDAANLVTGCPGEVRWQCRVVRGYVARQPRVHPLSGGESHVGTGAIAMVFAKDIPKGLTNEDAVFFQDTYFRVALLETLSPDATPLVQKYQLTEWRDALNEHRRSPL